MPGSTNPRGNHLLAALPNGDWERWRPQLEQVEMPLGQVLYESGSTLSHVQAEPWFRAPARVCVTHWTSNCAGGCC